MIMSFALYIGVASIRHDLSRPARPAADRYRRRWPARAEVARRRDYLPWGCDRNRAGSREHDRRAGQRQDHRR